MKNADRQHRQWVQRRYGLSPNAYRRLWDWQEGRCALCWTPEAKLPGGRLCVDHCHRTGQVRGLLCRPCNAALGSAEKHDTGQYGWYLLSPPAKKALRPEGQSVQAPAA